MMLGHLIFWRAHRLHNHRDDWRQRYSAETAEHSQSEVAAFDRVLNHRYMIAPDR